MSASLRFRFLCVVFFACTDTQAGFAQSLATVPGSWFANERSFGLLFQKSDMHPYFLSGSCEPSSRQTQARLNLEVEPKLFGSAVTNGEYIIVQWTDGSLKADLTVEGIHLNGGANTGGRPSSGSMLGR
jgi:hypothetical protein